MHQSTLLQSFFIAALLITTSYSATAPKKLSSMQMTILQNNAFIKSLSTKNIEHEQWKRKRGSNDDEIYVVDQDWTGTNSDGEGRKTMIFDDLFNITETWSGSGVPYYLDQFTQQKDRIPSNFYIPNASTNVKKFPKGYFYMIDSCDSVINTEQHNLNYNCLKNNCTDYYVGLVMFGVIAKMDFEKDGLMFKSCGIAKIDATNQTCLEIFPTPTKGCKVTHISDYTVDSDLLFIDQGYLIQSDYYTKTYSGLTGLIKDLADQTGQTFTLPDGSLTNGK